MTANGTKKKTTKAQLQEAREQLELIKVQEQLAVHTKRKRLTESSSWFDVFDFFGPLAGGDLERFRDGNADLFYNISTASDRQFGDNWPFWRNWHEHSRLRARARLVEGMSFVAQALLGGLSGFVIEKGYEYDVVNVMGKKGSNDLAPLEKQVTHIIDQFREKNLWSEMEQELFCRSRRDGEYFLRLWDQKDGIPLARVIEPEHVIEPPNFDAGTQKYGVISHPDDLQTVEGFWVAPDGQAVNGQAVSSEDVQHVKINVDRTVKRGMTDFSYQTYDLLRTAGRAVENVGEATAIQSSIAMVREWENSTQDVVESAVLGRSDYTRPNAFTSEDWNYETYPKGRIEDIPKGMRYAEGPFAGNADRFVAAVNQLLSAVAVRWNAPPWILTGEANQSSFASSLTAENPFVKKCLQWQQFYGARFVEILWRVIRSYVQSRGGSITVQGQSYTYKDMRQLLRIEPSAPPVETRNKSQEATIDTQQVQMKAKSPQQVARENGLDPEEMFAEWEEFTERFPDASGGGMDLGKLFGGGDEDDVPQPGEGTPEEGLPGGAGEEPEL